MVKRTWYRSTSPNLSTEFDTNAHWRDYSRSDSLRLSCRRQKLFSIYEPYLSESMVFLSQSFLVNAGGPQGSVLAIFCSIHPIWSTYLPVMLSCSVPFFATPHLTPTLIATINVISASLDPALEHICCPRFHVDSNAFEASLLSAIQRCSG